MTQTARSRDIGLLSRTVFGSPEIRFIFPVCIRSPSNHDIAFVGDSFVRIEEIQSDGRLLPVACKSDFACRICAAQVLGDPNAVVRPNTDAKSEPADDLPPQLLLLILESNELLLLTIDHANGGHAAITVHSHPLPGAIVPARAPRGHLAIDPYSRALAVAAQSKAVFISDIRSSRKWTSNLDNVFTRSLLIPADVDITNVDFLYPPTTKRDFIFLLIIGFSKGRLTMLLYEWECGGSKRPSLIPQTIPPQFIREHGLPQMLIPMEKNPGNFLLACDRFVALYQDAHVGQPTVTCSSSLKELSETAFINYNCPSASKTPLWKAWARPNRNTRDKRKGDEEDFYLAREDGIVCFMQVRKTRWSVQRAGKLNGHVEAAFNHDGRGLGLPDGIVHGGSLSDGGIYEIGRGLPFDGDDTRNRHEAMSPEQTETLYNWAPFTDVAVAFPDSRNVRDRQVSPASPGSGKSARNHYTPNNKPRVFGTSGRSPFGAVSQMRYGCEAIIDKLIDIGQGEMRPRVAATRMWAFMAPKGFAHIFLSSPNGTQVLIINTYMTEEAVMEPITTEETLELAKIVPSSPKAGAKAAESFILVTSSSIKLIALANKAQEVVELASLDMFDIMAASVRAADSLVVVAEKNKITLYHISFAGEVPTLTSVGDSLDIEVEPTCASLIELGQVIKFQRFEGQDRGQGTRLLAVVGLVSGDVQLISVSPTHGLEKIAVFSVCGDSGTVEADACASIAPMCLGGATGTETHTLLLCGLRSGNLHIVEVRPSSDASISVNLIEQIPIGLNAVKVHTETIGKNTAILHCGDHAMLLDYAEGSCRQPLINNIWFMDHADRSFTPGSISALTTIPPDRSGTLERLVAVAGTDLSINTLSAQPKALPLRFAVQGTPSRVCYSSHYERLFVASTIASTERGKRWNLATISIIDPVAVPYLVPEPSYYCEIGERITSLLEWMFVRDKKQYHHLVATTYKQSTDGSTSGRIILLKVVRMKGKKQMVTDEETNEQVEVQRPDQLFLDEAKIYEDDHPILAMCFYDNETLLYCSGNMIKKYYYSADDQRSRMQTLYNLGAAGPGQYITARKPFVLVSTKIGSLRGFVIDGDNATPTVADDCAREGLSHLLLSESGEDVVLWSDKSQHVAGMRAEAGAPAPLTARLPVSVTALRKADVRPPWKRAPIHGAVCRDVLGVSADGSLRSFMVLNEPAWRLLRFLQNMCLRHEQTAPTGRLPSGEPIGHIEPDARKASNMHVDGDILATLFNNKHSAELLNSMLDSTPEEDDDPDGRTDFATPEARRGRFTMLVRAVYDMAHETITDDTSEADSVESCSRSLEALGKDPVEGALEYLREVLAVPF